MPALRRGRMLKRWRYLGIFGPKVMLCACEVAVGPLRQRFWAVAEPGGALVESTRPVAGPMLGAVGGELGTVHLELAGAGARAELERDLGAGPPSIEVVAPSGSRGYVWTRKQAGAPVRGRVEVGGRRLAVEAHAVLDDTAGYHAHRTSWHWCAGVGRIDDGRAVAWNLVAGANDPPRGSERTVWMDGLPAEAAPVCFASDLSTLSFAGGDGELLLETWATRAESTSLGVLSSRIRQPFGTFSGSLPGGLRLAEGYGVMEAHDARW